MMEKKRTPSRLLVSVTFVALSGLAVSCGEEAPSGGAGEKPPQKAESAQKPPATPKAAEETTARVEKPKTEKPKTEKPQAEAAPVQAAPVEALPAEGEPAQGMPEEELVAEQGKTAEADAYAYEYQYADAPNDTTADVADAPSDTTMYLSVPALGISGTPVIDENSEAALTAGTMHMPGTGFPWQEGSNTYIAGHRIGYPGTPSDHIFYNLPSMSVGDAVTLTDANGQAYDYSVSEIFAVTPFDTWVTGPTGADTVTLQVCTETPDDWTTIGPSLMSSGPESGRLIVRATRV